MDISDIILPAPKVYQFRSTARAWRSKYKRHIGTKQLIKQFKSELPHLSCEQLDILSKRLIEDTSMPPLANEAISELLYARAAELRHTLPMP